MIFKSKKYKESCKKSIYFDWEHLNDIRCMIKEINKSFNHAQYVTYMADEPGKVKANYPCTWQGCTGYRACRNIYERLMSLNLNMEEFNLLHIYISDLEYLTQYETRETEASRKTLATLKSKGVYTTNIEEPILKLPDQFGRFFSNLLLNQYHLKEYLKPEIFDLTDNDWLAAIELTALKYDNSILKKAYLHTYWPMIKDNLDELYENVILCHCTNVLSDAIHAELIEKPSVFSSADEEKLRKKQKSLQRDNDELKEKITELRKKAKHSIDESVIEQREEFYEKTLNELEKKNAAQQAEINKLKKDLERAENKINELEKIEKAEEQDEVRIESQPSETVDLPELPETGVAFFGGHPNFVKKVEALHPDWRYYQDESGIGFSFGTGIGLIIIRSEHMSHSLFAKAMQAKEQIPVIYSSATNIDMLEDELKQEYAKVVGNVEDD